MHVPINVKSPNNISKWQMGFNSAFKGLILKALKNHYNNNKKRLQHHGRRHLEQYVFDTFVPVVCVLTMEIFWGCTSLFYE
jgi:hypothetical protein